MGILATHAEACKWETYVQCLSSYRQAQCVHLCVRRRPHNSCLCCVYRMTHSAITLTRPYPTRDWLHSTKWRRLCARPHNKYFPYMNIVKCLYIGCREFLSGSPRPKTSFPRFRTWTLLGERGEPGIFSHLVMTWFERARILQQKLNRFALCWINYMFNVWCVEYSPFTR